ncbi:hypothetical protein [Caulobacter endophyticus]|uniref:Cell envelope biogenesis protein TolA n=1 Tax=Caulobacter endophyticus TaxID=2172652 RepID=A0A2T9JS12_9CAUL|nr:hypothetical protein [Caulobacter endophyticus]PVM86484.1 hypothetical protein DDF67_16025 [Caulobacter endophyticus]
MAKAPVRRLKVYEARFGFHDSVVAAPNQKAALDAWGVRQDLFAEGDARVSEDEAAVKAALAHPGTPLRRAAGSNDPFGLAPNLPDIPDAPRKPKAKARATRPAEPPAPPDRSALDRAEADLAELETRQDDEKTELDRRMAVLEKEIAAARRRWRSERKKAQAVVDKERSAYRDAGG